MKKIFALALLLFTVTSCGKSGSSGPTDFTPGSVSLTSPSINSTCTTGTVVSTTVSTVLFTWNGATNAESYDLHIENLLDTSKIVQTTTVTQLQVNINRNTPYAWYVVSKSSKSSATGKSDTWKFYNSGIATSSYAPFPASIIAPAFGQAVTATAGNVTLSWSGSSVDNDIIGYDIYAGTSLTNLTIVKSGQVAPAFNLPVTSGTAYYWKIVTNDSKGNSSVSGISQFTVN